MQFKRGGTLQQTYIWCWCFTTNPVKLISFTVKTENNDINNKNIALLAKSNDNIIPNMGVLLLLPLKFFPSITCLSVVDYFNALIFLEH